MKKSNGLERGEVLSIVRDFLLEFSSVLGLEHPVTIELNNAKKYYAKYETELYLDENKNMGYLHVITLSMRYATSAHEILDTFAHELCHAAQVERGEEPDHGPSFDRLANKLVKKFTGLTITKEGEYL